MTTTLPCSSAPVKTPAREPPRTPPDPLGLELRQPASDRWIAILPNPAPGQARYKLQYFTLSGLAGHQPYASPQAAYRAARRQGYTDPDPGALDRLSQTPAWATTYDTPAAAPLSRAVAQVMKALARLEQDGATVETVTLRRGRVPPRIVVSTPVPALTWRCYVWGHDPRGRYRRLTAALEGCQVVREVRDGPARSYPRR
ncbi:MAG TPA: hypothetical protein VES89_04425 [Candidatus Competibacteraceae bacterium]|nr:hypothetical protein [Candidatus Competibacteraceae bacterium]